MTQENLPGTLKVAIVDTEMTGLEYDDQAVSVGIVLVEIAMPKGTLVREIDSYYGLREPTVTISDGARAVHGLSDDDLAGKALDMAKLRALVKSADVLVAHNAQFDSRILGQLVRDGLGRRVRPDSALTGRGNQWDSGGTSCASCGTYIPCNAC